MTTNNFHSEDASDADGLGKIDLSKYQTSELSEKLVDLLSVPGAFRRIVKTAAFTAILTIVACFLIREYSDLTLVPLLVVCAYSLVLGALFGLLLGVLRVIATAMTNIESVLKIILAITGKVAGDYEQIQSGKVQLPSGGELVEKVYEGVVFPVIERAISGAFGFLGVPLLWTYNRTIGFAVRRLVKLVNRINVSRGDEQNLTQNVESGMANISKYSETITAYTSKAAELVGSSARKVRFYGMAPMYALFVLFLAVATLPILLVWYFSGK